MSFWQSEKDGDNFSYRVVQRACVGPNESYQFYMGGVAMATHVEVDRPVTVARHACRCA